VYKSGADGGDNHSPSMPKREKPHKEDVGEEGKPGMDPVIPKEPKGKRKARKKRERKRKVRGMRKEQNRVATEGAGTPEARPVKRMLTADDPMPELRQAPDEMMREVAKGELSHWDLLKQGYGYGRIF